MVTSLLRGITNGTLDTSGMWAHGPVGLNDRLDGDLAAARTCQKSPSAVTELQAISPLRQYRAMSAVYSFRFCVIYVWLHGKRWSDGWALSGADRLGRWPRPVPTPADALQPALS